MLLKISDILVDHDNNVSRDAFSPEICEELAASIEQHGMLHPVLCRPIEHEQYKYQLVVGYRRMIAVSAILGWVEIESSVREMTDQQAKIFNIIENNEREGLTFWEECSMLERTFDPDTADLEIARALGVSRGWVRNRWSLFKMPDEIIAHVEAGLLSASQVNMLITKSDEEKKATAALIIKGHEEGMTTQEIGERYAGRKGVRAKKDVQAMMTKLMAQERMSEMQCLRWAIGEINETLLWELL